MNTFNLRKLRVFYAQIANLGIPLPSSTVISKWLLQTFVKSLTTVAYRVKLQGSFHHEDFLHQCEHKMDQSYLMCLVEQICESGMTVLDIGAHIGMVSLIAGKAVGAAGKVYAFEPDPINFRYLTRNILMNDLSKVIIPSQLAAGDRNGRSDFYTVEKSGRTGNSFFQDEKWSRHNLDTNKISCEVVRLDDYLDGKEGLNEIGLIKIDVEGAELLVLKGIEKLIRESNRPLKLIVEVNHKTLKAAGQTSEELVEALETLGCAIDVIDEERKQIVPFRNDLLQYKRKAINLCCTLVH